MKTHNSDVILFIEHVARELDIACLIKYYLEQLNTTVTIVSLPYRKKFKLNKKNVKILVFPYCFSLGIYKSIISGCFDVTILNLAYEQIFQNINVELKAPKDIFAQNYVLHHSWSNHFSNYLMNYGVKQDNIILNGNLSYALYNKKYRDYFPSRIDLAEQFNLNPHKKWVFIPENYAAAFYSETKIKEKINYGIDPDEIYRYTEFASHSLKIVIQWCIDILKREDIEIIFRPRPAVSLDKMKKFFSEVNQDLPANLKIIKEKTVREWILASDIVISSYSTTLIEAAIAEKPIAMLAPIPFPHYIEAIWYEMVSKLTGFDEFKTFISDTPSGSFKSLECWAETEMMSKGNPIFGIVTIISHLKKKGYPIPKVFCKMPIGNSILSIMVTIFYHFRALIDNYRNHQSELMDLYEQDFFTDEDVKQRVERWKRVIEH